MTISAAWRVVRAIDVADEPEPPRPPVIQYTPPSRQRHLQSQQGKNNSKYKAD